MTKFGVSEAKENALFYKMQELDLNESDLVEKFISGSGPGGQKINKSSICVYLKHLPSGLEVKCQEGRSQALNRYYARYRLCELITEQIKSEKSKRQQASEKIRRQKRRRSRKAKEKILLNKKLRSAVKTKRRRVGSGEE